MRHATTKTTRHTLVVVTAWLASTAVYSPAFAQSYDQSVRPACSPSFFTNRGLYAAAIHCEHAACLDDLALKLTLKLKLTLVIDGHRDRRERPGISLTRANFQKRYLVEEKRIDPARILVRNFADTCPHKANGRALNSRVEHWLVQEGTGETEIDLLKECMNNSTPRVVIEKPAPWKRAWKSEALY